MMTAALVGANFCLIAVVSMQVAGYVWWHGVFSELAACTLLLAAVVLVLVWLRLQWRLDRARTVRRLAKSELPFAETAARRLLRRRAFAVHSMMLLGVCAVFALVSGTLGDDPAWRALIDGDPGISPVTITSIGEVEKSSSRRGPRYSFEFTGSIPTSTSFHLVNDQISTKVDPRGTDNWDGLVWAVYDSDDVSSGIVFVDSYSEAVQVTRFPLTPVLGFGGYVLILLSAAAFSKPPSKWIAEVSEGGRLAYYRGNVHRLCRADMIILGFLGLVAGIVYLGCSLRLVPTTGFTDELFDAASTGVFVYGIAMHIVALFIANLLADLAIGDARVPLR
ncbi:hypothetical protein [Glycomyces buryatensis]|uniref:Uncharacterized protein n=1 Tax=Glycomyces buryatensis TaxID=2570927 RepID=A0A4S8QJE8_9ACTN|nr:hypothetical protein [Glycomyces buryatensis]THV41499.1 hypothetical protein FAB82_11270 [Glycomyces buryatensis]